MSNPDHAGVGKAWLYAAASVTLGAWISPWLYNAGKALAEVSSSKTTNDALASLATVCRMAGYPQVYTFSMVLAAVLLLFPWLEWLRPAMTADRPDHGQPLRADFRHCWHAGAGLLLVSGLWLILAMVPMQADKLTLIAPHEGWTSLAALTFGKALALAVICEGLFRGITLGLFLRAMRPSAAIAMNAAFFTLALTAIAPHDLNVADPDAPGTGFELLRLIAWRLADWHSLATHTAPMFALGGVLAYARWRTASLWLPIGLLTGSAFAAILLDGLIPATPPHPQSAIAATWLQPGWIPWLAILLTGVLTHHLTTTRQSHGRTSDS